MGYDPRAFDSKYMPRTSVKGQVLTDLVAEFAEAPFENEIEVQRMDGKSVASITLQEPYTGKCMLIEQQTKGDPEWG